MLELRSVTQRYGPLVALDDVSLEVARGEFFGLLGPNGAGKSTLMSLVAGLRAPGAGSLRIDGRAVSPRDVAARGALGFVPQGIALYGELSAEQNLRIFGRLYGLKGTVLRERVDEALNRVQLADRRRDLVRTFSGGMQRRLNLVASLLHRPKLLLCDEPTVGVDPQSRNAIFELLEQLNREGLTIIYSTHYMEGGDAAVLADRDHRPWEDSRPGLARRVAGAAPVYRRGRISRDPGHGGLCDATRAAWPADFGGGDAPVRERGGVPALGVLRARRAAWCVAADFCACPTDPRGGVSPPDRPPAARVT